MKFYPLQGVLREVERGSQGFCQIVNSRSMADYLMKNITKSKRCSDDKKEDA